MDKGKEEQALKSHYYEDIGNGDFGPGWKIVFDNFDMYQGVHDMTEDNQNKDIHWVNHVKVSNRVSGNELPDDKPIKNGLSDLDNSKVVPSAIEHIYQRANYVNLVSRVLVEKIPNLVPRAVFENAAKGKGHGTGWSVM